MHVRYNDPEAALVLLVTAGRGDALFGRNWLRYIRLNVDWKAVHSVRLVKPQPKLNDLISQHKELFSEELGKI